MTDGTPVIDGSGHAAPFWRSRWGWIAAHVLCGIAAAAIGFGVLLAVSFASGTGLALGLMTLAALIGLVPLVTYQSRTLRNAVAPWAWVLAWVAAVLPASWIVAVVLRAIVLHWGNDTVFAAWIAGAALAGLWGALVQWPALRRKIGFARWMAGGGTGLALGTLVVGLGFLASLLIFPLIWAIAVPVAFGLYGALSWRALGPLIAG